MKRKLSWRLRPAVSVSNKKNGFLLADAVTASVIGVFLFTPALMLTAQAVSAYRQARHIIGAAAAGRSEMETLRGEGKNFSSQKEVTGLRGTYTLHSQAESIDGLYIRYRVEVQDPDGGVHVFIRLAESEES